jgi:hypothetical protein
MYYLAMSTSKIERIFVGETDLRLLAPKNDCILHHKVGDIDLRGQFHQHSTPSFCANSLAPVKYKPKT